MKMTIVTDSHGNLVGAVHGHTLTEKRGEVEATVSFPSTHKLHQVEVEDDMANITDVELFLKRNKAARTALKGDDIYPGGDFRSPECIALLKSADIVVTNPPFSLFREYVAQLAEDGKKFLVIGNVQALTYKEIFPLVKANKVWLGATIHSGDREFRVPEHYPLAAAGYRVDEKGVKYIRVKGVRWA